MKSILKEIKKVTSHGIILVDNTKVIDSLPTKINQDILFVDVETRRVYENYAINDEVIKRQLGFFNELYKYVQNNMKYLYISIINLIYVHISDPPPGTFVPLIGLRITILISPLICISPMNHFKHRSHVSARLNSNARNCAPRFSR